MANYQSPGTRVEVLPNPRLVALGDTTRLPGVVGYGRSVVTVVDQPITLNGFSASGSAWADDLPGEAAASAAITFTKVANVPNTSPANPNYSDNVYASGFYQASSSDGKLHWQLSGTEHPRTVAGGVLGTEAQTYYASYFYTVPSTHYDPVLFTDKKEILNVFGAEGVSSGTGTCGVLTVAGNLVLENGAPGVWLCQSESNDVTGYGAAIDKIRRIKGIKSIHAVMPSGSWTQTNINSVHALLFTHCQTMSGDQFQQERVTIIGDASTKFASSGGRNKDTEALSTYTAKAATYNSKLVSYVYPPYATRDVTVSGVVSTLTLDGNYIATALGGLRSAQARDIIPVTGMHLVGLNIENNKLEAPEQDILGAGSVVVITSQDDVITVRHDITTDPSSADTQAPTVVEAEFLVKRTLRTKINQMYFGKGIVVTPQTPSAIQASSNSILASLVASKDIADYGKKNNPVTGEVPTRAWQDSTEPRKIWVTGSVKYAYPLDWVQFTISTFV